jgi:hypothetical protein
VSRAIFVPSSKGGVGKTTFARLLAEMLRESNSGAVLVDADQGVGQLLKHLGERDTKGKLVPIQSIEHGVQVMDWHADVRGRDRVAEMVGHGKDVLIDMPGGSLSTFKALDDETGFFTRVLASMGVAATICVLVTPYVETWSDAKSVREWLPSADLLLVRNEAFGEPLDFRDWDSSETRANLKCNGATEIVLPRLEPRIAARVAQYRLRFHDAPTSDKVHVMDQGRAYRWLEKARAAMSEASAILALELTSRPGET